jgi:hypothetical protein
MTTPFDRYGQLLREQVSAIVAAELARDPSPAALMPMWVVVDGRKADRAGGFIAFDAERQRIGLGRYEGHTAWYEGESGSFLDLVARLAGKATGGDCVRRAHRAA